MKKLIVFCSSLILLSFFSSCDDKIDDIDIESNWQVYEEWGSEMYVGSGTVVGEPAIPTLVLNGSLLPGATYQNSNMPWTIQGSITSGILSIDFSKTLNLSNEYTSEHTNGIKIARVHIRNENSRNQHLALHKLDEQNPGVKIYYTDNDATYQTRKGAEIQLKAGWNFWNQDNNFISQDINDFFNQGYKWKWESWD